MIHPKNLSTSRRFVKLVVSLSMLFVLGIVTFIPYSGPVVGLSPISPALAAPGGCDKDGDFYIKDSHRAVATKTETSISRTAPVVRTSSRMSKNTIVTIASGPT